MEVINFCNVLPVFDQQEKMSWPHSALPLHPEQTLHIYYKVSTVIIKT